VAGPAKARGAPEQDHDGHRNQQAHEWIGEGKAQPDTGDTGDTGDDGERREAVRAGVDAVGDQGGGAYPPVDTDPVDRNKLVAGEVLRAAEAVRVRARGLAPAEEERDHS